MLVTGARHGMGSNEWVGKCQSMAVLLGLRGPEMFKGLSWDLYACLSLPWPVSGLLADRAWFWLMADRVGEYAVKAMGNRYLALQMGGDVAEWITHRLEWIDVYHRGCQNVAAQKAELGEQMQIVNLDRAQAKAARHLLGQWYNRWYARMEEVAKAAIT